MIWIQSDNSDLKTISSPFVSMVNLVFKTLNNLSHMVFILFYFGFVFFFSYFLFSFSNNNYFFVKMLLDYNEIINITSIWFVDYG